MAISCTTHHCHTCPFTLRVRAAGYQLAAAAIVAAATIVGFIAVVAAKSAEQEEDDDPPPVVAEAVAVIAHNYLRLGSRLPISASLVGI